MSYVEEKAPRSLRRCLTAGFVAGVLGLTPATTAFAGLQKQGSEFPATSSLAGDQVRTAASVGASGGIVIWDDNSNKAAGTGIRARRITRNMIPTGPEFRVNSTTSGDQESASVAVLPSGAALFAWTGGERSYRKVYVRSMKSDGSFEAPEFVVSPASHTDASNPSVAVLKDGSLVVAWSAFGADADMQGVAFQRLSQDGKLLGGVEVANIETYYNQRDVAIAPLASGDFALAWITENQRFDNSVDLFGRVFSAQGLPLGDEVQLNSGDDVCALPALAVDEGGILAAWSSRSMLAPASSTQWDLVVRKFSTDLSAKTDVHALNGFRDKDQYGVKLAATSNGFISVWTSDRQDGSGKGIIARSIGNDGIPEDDETLVNTTTVSEQIDPTIIADSQSNGLVFWSSFTGVGAGFELFAQKVGKAQGAIAAPEPPIATPISSSRLLVTWPSASIPEVVGYEIKFDSEIYTATGENFWRPVNLLSPSSVHQIALRYVLRDGSKSAWSSTIEGRSHGADLNEDGLPDDWQTAAYGPDSSKWPEGTADSDGDGQSDKKEFFAGTSAIDPAEVLRMNINYTGGQTVIGWNSIPGNVYQIELSADMQNWVPIQGTHFASTKSVQVAIPANDKGRFYRVNRIR